MQMNANLTTAPWTCPSDRRFRVEPRDCMRGQERYAATLEEARALVIEMFDDNPAVGTVGIWDAAIYDHPNCDDVPSWAEIEEWTAAEVIERLRLDLKLAERSAEISEARAEAGELEREIGRQFLDLGKRYPECLRAAARATSSREVAAMLDEVARIGEAK